MIWDELKNLKKAGFHNWGDPDKIDEGLLRMVDDLASSLRLTVVVTSGYRPGSNGYHGTGEALDIMCPMLNLIDFWIAAERYRFNGLGIYPHWTFDGRVMGGLHVDCRDLGGLMRGARWLCYKDASGQQVYTGLSRLNLKKYGVI